METKSICQVTFYLHIKKRKKCIYNGFILSFLKLLLLILCTWRHNRGIWTLSQFVNNAQFSKECPVFGSNLKMTGFYLLHWTFPKKSNFEFGQSNEFFCYHNLFIAHNRDNNSGIITYSYIVSLLHHGKEGPAKMSCLGAYIK